MNYVQKYFEEIFEDMLNDSLQKGLISHAEDFQAHIKNQEDISNYYILDKAVIAQMFSKVYDDITAVFNSINVDLAEGEDLDHIGKIVGVSRPEPTYAMCSLTFSKISSVEEDIVIDSGVMVSSNNGIRYRTTEEIYIPINESECTVEAMAVEAGSKSKVDSDTLTTIDSRTSNLMVTNSVSSGGYDGYSDTEYRELLKNWRLIFLKGSKEAYENYFARFDGIDGYKLVPNWDKSGTLKIIIDPGLPSQLNQAYSEIRKNVSQIDGDISLFAPVEKAIKVYAIVNVDIDSINPYNFNEKQMIKEKIVSSIKIFIDGGYRRNGDYYSGLKIGEDFIAHKLGVFLDAEIPELKSIVFTEPNDYVLIHDEEKGVSDTIDIEMV